jgi:hypothetical protein
MNKRIAAVSALAAIAITAGACGGDDGASVRKVGDDSSSGSGSGSVPSDSEVSPTE